MLDIGYLTPFIVLVVFLLVEVLKKTCIKTNKLKTWIPIASAILGAAIGVILYCIDTEWMMYSNNIISAIANGGFSGLAATGCNQIYKQYKKFRMELPEDNTIDENINDNNNDA